MIGTYDFEIKVDSIQEAKNAVLKQMHECNHKFGCGHICIQLFDDIELALDELLFNIIDHSSNENKRFKIIYKCDGEVIDILVSDCRVTSMKSRQVKIADKNKMMKNGTPHRGRGIAMVDYIMDDVKIFNVFDGTNKNKIKGMMVNIVKKIPKDVENAARIGA